MASFDEGAVVDPDLNVYGVKSLKVADLSIPRSNVGSNTCNVAMAIGEKAADIIIQELEPPAHEPPGMSKREKGLEKAEKWLKDIRVPIGIIRCFPCFCYEMTPLKELY